MWSPLALILPSPFTLSCPADVAQRQFRVLLGVDGGDDDDLQVDEVHGIVVRAQRGAQRVGVVAADGAAGRKGVPPGVEGEQHERQQAAASSSPSGEKNF